MSTKVVMKNKTRSGRSRRPNRARLGGTGRAVGRYVEDAASLGARTLSGLNQLRRLINVETKVCNTEATTTSFGTTGVVTCISQMAQGSNYTDRVGDSIRVQSIETRIKVFVNAAATISAARCIIFRDLDNYGTAPNISDVLDAGALGGNVLAQYNWLNRDRFSILYDEMFTLDLVANPGEMIGWKATHEGHVKYLGTTAAAGANGKGSIYILMVSDEATNTPTFRHSTRLTFTDN